MTPARIIRYILIALLACKVLSEVVLSLQMTYSYEGFEISDWLINYEGGFVRRGLIGEGLLACYSLYPIDIKTTILIFDFLWFGLFVLLMIRVCRQQGWSFLPVVFTLALISGGIPRYRRDYLIMLIVYGLLALFMRYRQRGGVALWSLIQALLCITILIYEPAFFILIPLLWVLYYASLEGPVFHRMVRATLAFIAPILTMAFACLWKGSADQASVIWQSWSDLFARYPESTGMPALGAGVAFLGNGMMETFHLHANILFAIDRWPQFTALMAPVLLLLSYPMIYGIVTRVPLLSERPENEQLTLRANFSSVFLILLVGLSPMLTVLSCDLERTIPYIVYTTYMCVHLANRYHVSLPFPEWLNKLSLSLQKRFSALPKADTFGGYVALYILFLATLFTWMLCAKGFLIVT